MKLYRLLLPLLAFACIAAAQNQPAIGPSILNIPAIRAILCPAGSCGDVWKFYLPTQGANGVNTVFTAPVAARAGGVKVYVDGVRMFQSSELPGGFSPQITVSVSGSVTTVTFSGAFVPAASDNVLIEATQ